MKPAVFLCANVALLGTMTTALGAPPQLLNKTIVVSWTEVNRQRVVGGREFGNQTNQEHVIYVSSLGRLFAKSVGVGSAGHVRRNESGPGNNKAGSFGSFALQGNAIVGYYVAEGIANRKTITFDKSFSSCNLTVTYGNSGAVRRRLGYDGTMLEVLSISVINTKCSIREGNALAS